MPPRTRLRAFARSAFGRSILCTVGGVCLLASPIIGLLPGPGGVPLALVGLTLLLRYATWTKKLYVRGKKRWPKQGRFADWGLRRGSTKRRAAVAKRAAVD